MNTLSELYTNTIEEEQAALASQSAQEAALLAEKQQAAATRLDEYLERWAPLRSALGLKGAPDFSQGRRALLSGQTTINNVPVLTTVWTDLPRWEGDQPNFYISIKSQQFPAAFCLEQIAEMVDGAEYPRRLGILCSVWMQHHAREAAEAERAERMKAEALTAARRIIELSKVYQERLALYKEECRQWAEQEAARLWTPHVLWRVRYLPVLGQGERYEDAVETVVCMESPDDILNALRQFPTATITTVDLNGGQEEMEIGSFLDARRLAFDVHEDSYCMNYHRSIGSSVGVVLNIPAHELREPVAKPPFPGWAAFLGETVDDGYISPWEDADPTRLAAMMPEEVLKHYLQVWTD